MHSRLASIGRHPFIECCRITRNHKSRVILFAPRHEGRTLASSARIKDLLFGRRLLHPPRLRRCFVWGARRHADDTNCTVTLTPAKDHRPARSPLGNPSPQQCVATRAARSAPSSSPLSVAGRAFENLCADLEHGSRLLLRGCAFGPEFLSRSLKRFGRRWPG
jgi:hypothetical protein